MRDATVGVETLESLRERRHIRYGIPLFEWRVSHSTTYADFCGGGARSLNDVVARLRLEVRQTLGLFHHL